MVVEVPSEEEERTVQKYTEEARRSGPSGQTWRTFLDNHAGQIWACDFLQTYDVFFHPICLFFIVEHGRRQVIHAGVTRHPTAAWVAQQLRGATPFGEGPKFIIRDNDAKFGNTMVIDVADHRLKKRERYP